MPSNSQKLESVLLKALLIFCGFICFFVATSPSKVLAADDVDIAVVGEKLGRSKWPSVKEFKREINDANTRLCNPREADDAKRGSDFESGGCAGWISMAENGKWYPIQIVVDRSEGNKNKAQQTNKNEAQQTMIFLCRFGYTGGSSWSPNDEKNMGTGWNSVATNVSRLTPKYAYKSNVILNAYDTSNPVKAKLKWGSESDKDVYVINKKLRNSDSHEYRHDRTSVYLPEDLTIETQYKVTDVSDSIRNFYIPAPTRKVMRTVVGGLSETGLGQSENYISMYYGIHIFTNCPKRYVIYADLAFADGIYKLMCHDGNSTLKSPKGTTDWGKEVQQILEDGYKKYYVGADRLEGHYTWDKATGAHYSWSHIAFTYQKAAETYHYRYVDGYNQPGFKNETISDYIWAEPRIKGAKYGGVKNDLFSINFGQVIPLVQPSSLSVKIKKVDSEDKTKVIPDAKIKLYYSTKPNADGTPNFNSQGKAGTTNDKGELEFKNIGTGVDYTRKTFAIKLVETEANEKKGYQLPSDEDRTCIIKLADLYDDNGEPKAKGVTKGLWTFKLKQDDAGDTIQVTLKNDKSSAKLTIIKRPKEDHKQGLNGAVFKVFRAWYDTDANKTDLKVETIDGKKYVLLDTVTTATQPGSDDSKKGYAELTLPDAYTNKQSQYHGNDYKKLRVYYVQEITPPKGRMYNVATGANADSNGETYSRLYKIDLNQLEQRGNEVYAAEKADPDNESDVFYLKYKAKAKKSGKDDEDSKKQYDLHAYLTVYDPKAVGVDISFDKVDSQTGKKLKGAGFKILRYTRYDISTGTKLSTLQLLNAKTDKVQNVSGDVWKNAKSYLTIVTDENGHGEKKGLTAGFYDKKNRWHPFIYKIKEYQTPYDGSYKLNETVYVVTADSGYHAAQGETLKKFSHTSDTVEASEIDLGEIKDEPIKYYGNLKLIKVDAEGNEDGSDYYIEGAGFTLYADGTIVGTEKKTGADGVVEWTNLPLTKDDGTWIVYTYQETIKPEYTRKNDDGTPKTGDNGQKLEYQLDPTVYTITSDMWMTEKDKNPNTNPI